jgi:two-component system KDP operon response regulator KdpE
MASILIVDADHAISTALRVLLEYKGFEVRIAETGAAALGALAALGADLIVVDVTGRELRDDSAWVGLLRAKAPAVPIIAVGHSVSAGCGRPAEDALARAVALGATAVLRKPFRPADLLDAIATSRSEPGSGS